MPVTQTRILFPSIAIARERTPFFIDEEGVGVWLSTDDPALLDGMTVIPTRRMPFTATQYGKNRSGHPQKIADRVLSAAPETSA
ncbi:MAG: hypothetical protein U0401_25765 [Anaerolineae bacterium]